MAQKKPSHGKLSLFGLEFGLLFLRFGLEFFLDLFDVHVLNHRLKVLDLQGLTSNRRFCFVFAVLSLQSCYWHGTNYFGNAKVGRLCCIPNILTKKSNDSMAGWLVPATWFLLPWFLLLATHLQGENVRFAPIYYGKANFT